MRLAGGVEGPGGLAQSRPPPTQQGGTLAPGVSVGSRPTGWSGRTCPSGPCRLCPRPQQSAAGLEASQTPPPLLQSLGLPVCACSFNYLSGLKDVLFDPLLGHLEVMVCYNESSEQAGNSV